MRAYRLIRRGFARNVGRHPALRALDSYCSSVAGGTTRQNARALNFVFGDQFAPDLFLIARRLVSHSGNEFSRPQNPFGMAVTVEAPLHLKRVFLPGKRHSIHSSMATLATH